MNLNEAQAIIRENFPHADYLTPLQAAILMVEAVEQAKQPEPVTWNLVDRQPKRAPTTYPMTAEEAGAVLAGLRAKPHPASVVTHPIGDVSKQPKGVTTTTGENTLFLSEAEIQKAQSAAWEQAVNQAEREIVFGEEKPSYAQIKETFTQLRQSLAKCFAPDWIPEVKAMLVEQQAACEACETRLASLPVGGITEQECLELVDQTLHPHYVTMGKPLAEKLYRLLKAKFAQPTSGITAEKLAGLLENLAHDLQGVCDTTDSGRTTKRRTIARHTGIILSSLYSQPASGITAEKLAKSLTGENP